MYVRMQLHHMKFQTRTQQLERMLQNEAKHLIKKQDILLEKVTSYDNRL